MLAVFGKGERIADFGIFGKFDAVYTGRGKIDAFAALTGKYDYGRILVIRKRRFKCALSSIELFGCRFNGGKAVSNLVSAYTGITVGAGCFARVPIPKRIVYVVACGFEAAFYGSRARRVARARTRTAYEKVGRSLAEHANFGLPGVSVLPYRRGKGKNVAFVLHEHEAFFAYPFVEVVACFNYFVFAAEGAIVVTLYVLHGIRACRKRRHGHRYCQHETRGGRTQL